MGVGVGVGGHVVHGEGGGEVGGVRFWVVLYYPLVVGEFIVIRHYTCVFEVLERRLVE